MVFDARAEAEKARRKYQPFTFVAMDGQEHEITNINLLDGNQVAQLEAAYNGYVDSGDDSAVREAFMQITTPEAYDALVELPQAVGRQLVEEWQRTMDDSGKSQSPPEPRNRAERRSRRTTRSEVSARTG